MEEIRVNTYSVSSDYSLKIRGNSSGNGGSSGSSNGNENKERSYTCIGLVFPFPLGKDNLLVTKDENNTIENIYKCMNYKVISESTF